MDSGFHGALSLVSWLLQTQVAVPCGASPAPLEVHLQQESQLIIMPVRVTAAVPMAEDEHSCGPSSYRN